MWCVLSLNFTWWLSLRTKLFCKGYIFSSIYLNRKANNKWRSITMLAVISNSSNHKLEYHKITHRNNKCVPCNCLCHLERATVVLCSIIDCFYIWTVFSPNAVYVLAKEWICLSNLLVFCPHGHFQTEKWWTRFQ